MCAVAVMICSFAFSAFSANEIKIGVIYPLTGPAASTGQVLLEGVKLAVDIINNKNNLNMPLRKLKGCLI